MEGSAFEGGHKSQTGHHLSQHGMLLQQNIRQAKKVFSRAKLRGISALA